MSPHLPLQLTLSRTAGDGNPFATASPRRWT